MREDSGALSGREKASSCRAASFLSRSREHDISELSQHGICDTNTERASWSDERLRERQGHGENWNQEMKSREVEKRLERRKHGSEISCQLGGQG